MVFFMMLKRQYFKNLWEYVGVAELENYLFILGKVWGFHHPTPKIIAYKSRGELFLWNRMWYLGWFGPTAVLKISAILLKYSTFEGNCLMFSSAKQMKE